LLIWSWALRKRCNWPADLNHRTSRFSRVTGCEIIARPNSGSRGYIHYAARWRCRTRPNPMSAVPNRAKLAGSGTGVFGASLPDTASRPVLPAPGPEVFLLMASPSPERDRDSFGNYGALWLVDSCGAHPVPAGKGAANMPAAPTTRSKLPSNRCLNLGYEFRLPQQRNSTRIQLVPDNVDRLSAVNPR
jgi:hypothetical protein